MVSKRVPQEMSTDDQDSVPQVDRATARERDLVNSCDGWGGGVIMDQLYTPSLMKVHIIMCDWCGV